MSVVYTVEVEGSRPASDKKPSAGAVYRCIYAKDGLLELPAGLDSPWDFFRNPKNPVLGRRQLIEGGKAGPYTWVTYEEAYDTTLRIGFAIRGRGGDHCGIYGVNCPEWIMAMEACNSHAISYVPLYDSLGANAMEFIFNHAEVSIAFVQENKLPAILTCLPSFGKISSSQKKEAEEHGVACFSWEEFALLGRLDHELPPKQRADICTIMYTSGTTGEPKGVVLSNGSFMAEVLSID